MDLKEFAIYGLKIKIAQLEKELIELQRLLRELTMPKRSPGKKRKKKMSPAQKSALEKAWAANRKKRDKVKDQIEAAKESGL